MTMYSIEGTLICTYVHSCMESRQSGFEIKIGLGIPHFCESLSADMGQQQEENAFYITSTVGFLIPLTASSNGTHVNLGRILQQQVYF